MSLNSVEYWKEECLECRAINWMGVGSNDVEAYLCWKCGHKWLAEMAEEMKVVDRTIVSNNLLYVRLNSGGKYLTHTELRSIVFWMFGFGFIVHWGLGDLFFWPRQIMITYGKRGIRSLYHRPRY